MLRLLVALPVICTVVSPTQAAETSSLNILGFNKSGSHFAFEEYGISDGIGTPYVSVYAINVDSDQWVKGSPLRIKIGEGDGEPPKVDDYNELERRWLKQIRAEARASAQSFLGKLGDLNYGTVRVSNEPWEMSANAKIVRFTPVDLIPGDGKALKLSLQEAAFPAEEEACFGFRDKMYGFRLTLEDETTGKVKVLNDDKRVPKSRACPRNYRIEKVVTNEGNKGQRSLAVIIRYSTIGFEGDDGRLLAVTTRF